jgi:hypothetical protein
LLREDITKLEELKEYIRTSDVVPSKYYEMLCDIIDSCNKRLKNRSNISKRYKENHPEYTRIRKKLDYHRKVGNKDMVEKYQKELDDYFNKVR